MIILFAGKPDNYGGESTIEDKLSALIEAMPVVINSYCITIYKEVRDYLPRTYMVLCLYNHQRNIITDVKSF